MNYNQKNGTLFDKKNGNIVPCRIANPELLMLAAQLQYNSSVDLFFNFKRKH